MDFEHVKLCFFATRPQRKFDFSKLKGTENQSQINEQLMLTKCEKNYAKRLPKSMNIGSKINLEPTWVD